MTDIERVYSDADMTRTILAGVDHVSLPRDYLTSDMARDRMSEIECLRADNERLRAALLDIANMPTTHDGERIFGDIARRALKEGKDD